MLQSGYGFVPYSSLESVIEQNKDAYYLALRRTQSTIRQPSPDWQPWIDFFVQSVTTQVRNLEAKLEVERIVLAELPALSLTIIDFARNHGRVTMAQAIRLTRASRNTLKMHFRSLQAKGILVQRGRARGAWYELGETALSTAALSK
jgi:Fic family protein